jgi:tetratricopeptide (TPR) repeat protein
MTLHNQIRNQLLANLSEPQADTPAQLNNGLRLLSKWRSVLIQNTLLQSQGTVVMSGPLKGMDFLSESAEGCHIAKLLGCYEQPLQPHIEAAVQANYPRIINIGCAEGYYAVGMARRMPATQVLAFDLNPKAQEVCTALAAKNGVADRVSVGALFKPEDFAQYANQRVLVLCDIEGAERDLLNPAIAPALTGMDLIVESHECLIPGITKILIDRFSLTHDITLVEDNGQRDLAQSPQWFRNLSHLDQLLAVWEWRSGPTPWLVMKAKQMPSNAENVRLTALFKDGQYQQAIGQAQALTAQFPGFTFGWKVLGAALANLGKIDQALEAMQVAARLEPHDAELLFNIGTAQKEIRQFDGAIESYEGAIKVEARLCAGA